MPHSTNDSGGLQDLLLAARMQPRPAPSLDPRVAARIPPVLPQAQPSVDGQSRLSQILPLLLAGGTGRGGTGQRGSTGLSGALGALVQGQTEYPYRTFPSGQRQLPEDSPLLVTRRGVTTQRGPMRSLVDIARASNVRPGIQELGLIDQGYRSGASQAAGYAQSPGRFAAPGTSYHGSGLAIDAGNWARIPALRRALLESGWSQFDPQAEPWHFSYGVVG